MWFAGRQRPARPWPGLNETVSFVSVAAYLCPVLGIAGIYAAAAIAGLAFATVGNTITLLWAPSGIALAALLLMGLRMAPGVALGALVANAWTGVPWEIAAGVALGNTLEALAGAWLLTRYAGFRNALDRRRDVLALIALAAVASTTLSAAVGVSTLVLGGLLSSDLWVDAWTKWWLGDMMGVLVVAPALLVWAPANKPAFWSVLRSALITAKSVEAAVLAVALLGTSQLIFGAPELAEIGYYPAALAVFPFVIWAALSFGQLGATLLTVAVSALAVLGTTHGTGPFAVDHPVDSLTRWCLFAIVVAVTGLLLAASVMEQRRAQADLQASYAQLEQQVSDRTRDLQEANADLRREMTERRELENELVRISEVQHQAIGRELHDGLGQYLTSVMLLAASLNTRLKERGAPEAPTAERITELATQAGALTRDLARGLYPVALEFGGLAAALQRLAEQTRALATIHCDFKSDSSVKIEEGVVALNLYRIAQEAVNNAVKYSHAAHVRIELNSVDAGHRLCISDDGVGFDLALMKHQRGIGMHSMSYRAKLLGGQLSVAAQPNGGTCIVVTTAGNGAAA